MIDVKKLKIGDKLVHNKIGPIEVLGIEPHCSDYKIKTKDSWVYLKNCENIIIR